MRISPLFDVKIDSHVVCSADRVEDIFVGKLRCRKIRDGDRRRVYILLNFIEPRLADIGDENIDTVYVFSIIATRTKTIMIGVDDLSRLVRPKIPSKIIVVIDKKPYLLKPLSETRQQLWISLLRRLKHITLYNENGKLVTPDE